VTLTLFMGIPLLRSMDPEETATLMLFAARQGRAVASGALPRKGRRPQGKARVQNRLLQGLPGIGPERARRLLERFGTIEAVIAAPADALASVPGIAKRRQRRSAGRCKTAPPAMALSRIATPLANLTRGWHNPRGIRWPPNPISGATLPAAGIPAQM